MLALEDLVVANQVARRNLLGVEPLRAVLGRLDAHPTRVLLIRYLHEHQGVSLEQATALHEAARLYLRRRSEERFALLLRQAAAVPGPLLDALTQEQARAGFAWSLGDRLVREHGLTAERQRAVQDEAARSLAEEERRLLEKNRAQRFAPVLGGASAPGGSTPDARVPPGGSTPDARVPPGGSTPGPRPLVVPLPGGAPGFHDDLGIVGTPTIRMAPGEILPLPGAASGPGATDDGALEDAERTITLDTPGAAPPMALAQADTLDAERTLTLDATGGPPPLGTAALAEPEDAERTLTFSAPDHQASGQQPGAAPPAGPSLGTVGRFQLIRELGRGAMGVVYLAREPGRPDEVAVKLVQGPVNDEVTGRFRREILVSQRIKHPGVIEVFDAGQLPDGSGYMAMELLAGESLQAVLRREGALGIERSLHLLHELLEGLQAVHERQIVHRDLKPENLQVFTRDGVERVKIVDFGISRLLDEEEAASENLFVTMKGQLSGTPQYVAPEAVLDPEVVVLGHDVYACGVILYEMLTGVLPFPPARSLRDLLADTVHSRARPLDEANPAGAPYPEPLERFVRRFLEKDPELRPRDAARALDLLAAHRAGAPEQAVPVVGGGPERTPGLTARLLRRISDLFG